jgi:hypothetical protein
MLPISRFVGVPCNRYRLCCRPLLGSTINMLSDITTGERLPGTIYVRQRQLRFCTDPPRKWLAVANIGVVDDLADGTW